MKKLAAILVLMAAGSGIAAAKNIAQDTAQNTAQDRAAAPGAAAFWSADYAGPDQAALHCEAPDVPEVSQFNLRIRNVARAIEQWQDCQRRVMTVLDPAHAGKHIPAEALAAMSPDERAAALRHVAAVHARLAELLRREAAPVLARHEAWRDATVSYVAAQNGVRAGDAAVRRNQRSTRATRADELRQLRSQSGLAVR